MERERTCRLLTQPSKDELNQFYTSRTSPSEVSEGSYVQGDASVWHGGVVQQ